ncbi:MAG: response regulator [Candidatus Omnitrophica bacterium]|nr:response regulator [Candidatus Omnitrophota bacterium]
MRVLLVEDQLDILECLRLYFEEHGHEVATACTVEEAVGRLESMEPDIAFVDLILPGGHGRTVLQEMIKRRLPTRKIVITACDDLGLRRELLEMGVSDYLFKPVTIRDLDLLLNPAADPS